MNNKKSHQEPDIKELISAIEAFLNCAKVENYNHTTVIETLI